MDRSGRKSLRRVVTAFVCVAAGWVGLALPAAARAQGHAEEAAGGPRLRFGAAASGGGYTLLGRGGLDGGLGALGRVGAQLHDSFALCLQGSFETLLAEGFGVVGGSLDADFTIADRLG